MILERPDAPAVVAVYADGGTIAASPSEIGGVWAWAHVDAAGTRARVERGYLWPGEDDAPELIRSEHAEYLALLLALEALPAGWTGDVYSDCDGALLRVRCGPTSARLLVYPEAWAMRAQRARQRLGRLHTHRVAGHPKEAERLRGWRGRVRVSEHNIALDAECRRLAKAALAERRERDAS